MLETPFSVVRCAWPRPVVHEGLNWTSEPEWDAPAMPSLPQAKWMMFGRERAWTLDWRDVFSGNLQWWNGNQGAEMRGFHVVFRLRVNGSGTLVFWDDDGCIVRRNGEVVHTDRIAHPVTRHEIAVRAGDCLDIAHWQNHSEWLWGARLIPAQESLAQAAVSLKPYLLNVQAALQQPNGPPLKMMVQGGSPIQSVLALYSLVLNGYRPSETFIWGEHQWSPDCRKVLADLLPFAHFMPTSDLLKHIATVGGVQLASWAQQQWYVMKCCINLLHPPHIFGFIDDDLFILDSLDDALRAFETYDLVYQPDGDHWAEYAGVWKGLSKVESDWPTGTFNAGLFWLRNGHDPPELAAAMLGVPPLKIAPYLWEQGFMAAIFAESPTLALPAQRYLFPLFDGLPGGIMAYDYANNPCGFASVHFGGLRVKPDDADALVLAPSILRMRAL